MGRVINLESIGKDRTQLARSVVIAIHELLQQPDTGELAHDLAAFVSMALLAIEKTIDASVEAWEKRGYWVKADRFRMDWAWTGKQGALMRQAVLTEDWAGVAAAAVQVAEKLKKIEVPKRNRLGAPWEGAWGKLKEEEAKK